MIIEMTIKVLILFAKQNLLNFAQTSHTLQIHHLKLWYPLSSLG